MAMEGDDHDEDTNSNKGDSDNELNKEIEFPNSSLKEERANALKSLPDLTRRRICALRKLQKEYLYVEGKFYEEVHKLAAQFQEKLKPLYDKRSAVVSGSFTPNDDDLYEDDFYDASTCDATTPAGFVDSGIPDFWLTVLKVNCYTEDLVLPQDEPVLSKLIDVRVVWQEADLVSGSHGFTLEFYFAPNEFFSNTVLTKSYTLRFQPDENSPFGFEGPEIVKSKGCNIEWFKGKNVTIKITRKRQKQRGGPMTRTVTKQVKVPSFFNFFTPPKVPVDSELVDEDTLDELNADFEVGHYLKERVIPRAVLYYTGEIPDEDSCEESEFEETEDDDDLNDDDDDDDSETEERILIGDLSARTNENLSIR